MRRTTIGGLAMLLLLVFPPVSAVATPSGPEVRAGLSGLSLPFVANQGQLDAQVAYYARTFAGTVFVTQDGGLVYSLPARPTVDWRGKRRASREPGWRLSETFHDGQARPVGGERSAVGVSSFIGGDPSRWRAALPAYDRVGLGEVWPGVNVALRAQGKSIEKVFTVEPGAPVSRIRVRVGGAQALSVDSAGALVATTGLGVVTFTAPVAFQERDGMHQAVSVGYRLEGQDYRFEVGAYDPTLPLTIDPLLKSTYLGGTADDDISAVAVHPLSGKVYVTGSTDSVDFPETNNGYNAAVDAFVARLNSTLTEIEQATYLGGGDFDAAYALAIDAASGDVFVAGETSSCCFPGIDGSSAQPSLDGPGDGFVTRLPADLLSVVRSTFIGGDDLDVVNGLAIHPTNGVYAAGQTSSLIVPPAYVVGAAQPGYGGGTSDAFIARFLPDLTALQRFTFLGGSDFDAVYGIALNPTSGNVYVAGDTDSFDFPETTGGAQSTTPGTAGVAAVLSADLGTLAQSTYFGGFFDTAIAVAVHPATGHVYLAGVVSSTTLPGTGGAIQPALRGGSDGFVSSLNSTLTSVHRTTYLGGSANDVANALAIHPLNGDVYVAGVTRSADFPGTTNGAVATPGAEPDGFVARLTSNLTGISRATYLGGNSFDLATALAIHPTSGDVYVGGNTSSTNLAGAAGGAQEMPGGSLATIDGFVSLLTASLSSVDRPTSDRDFEGSSLSDILWRREISGEVAVWLMRGNKLLNSGVTPPVGLEWEIVGEAPPGWTGSQFNDLGDFNGDGRIDIPWRNTANGQLSVWFMNGTQPSAIPLVATVGLEWTVVRVGDFNGDGKADFLWRNNTGALAMWFMNGAALVGSTAVASVGLEWTTVGRGDFNGDGRADILWRNNTTGQVAVWLMNGASIIGSAVIGTEPLSSTPVLLGDFDGDGKTDILWWDTAGNLEIWLMDGTTVDSTIPLGTVSTTWTPVRLGDFDGDGKADILWRDTVGSLALWLSTNIPTGGFIGTVSPFWTIQ